MEHTGPALQHLSQDSRFTLTNMAIEAGAKSGIVPPDEVTLAYVRERQEATGRRTPFDVLAERPGRRRTRPSTRSTSRAGAAGLAALAAVESGARLCGRARRRRPGVHRLVHERQDRGPPDGRAHPARPPRRPARPADGDPGDAGDLAAGEPRGPARGVRGGGRHRVDADVRRVPGRAHGRARARRGLRVDVEPQLRRAHGAQGGQGLPGEPGRGGGDRGHGPPGAPRRDRRRTAGRRTTSPASGRRYGAVPRRRPAS